MQGDPYSAYGRARAFTRQHTDCRGEDETLERNLLKFTHSKDRDPYSGRWACSLHSGDDVVCARDASEATTATGSTTGIVDLRQVSCEKRIRRRRIPLDEDAPSRDPYAHLSGWCHTSQSSDCMLAYRSSRTKVAIMDHLLDSPKAQPLLSHASRFSSQYDRPACL